MENKFQNIIFQALNKVNKLLYSTGEKDSHIKSKRTQVFSNNKTKQFKKYKIR